jgi:hypothetical protein
MIALPSFSLLAPDGWQVAIAPTNATISANLLM